MTCVWHLLIALLHSCMLDIAIREEKERQLQAGE
jgi:hypothetical protein